MAEGAGVQSSGLHAFLPDHGFLRLSEMQKLFRIPMRAAGLTIQPDCNICEKRRPAAPPALLAEFAEAGAHVAEGLLKTIDPDALEKRPFSF